MLLILWVLGFVLVLLAGMGLPWGPPGTPRPWSLGWLGVACVILAVILAQTTGMHLLGK